MATTFEFGPQKDTVHISLTEAKPSSVVGTGWHWPMLAFMFAEMGLMSLFLLTVGPIQYAFHKTIRLHDNLKIIIHSIAFASLTWILTRVFIMFIQFEYILPTHGFIYLLPHILNGFHTHLLYWHILVIVLERGFATILVKSYDRKSRRWIAVLLLSIAVTSSLATSTMSRFKDYMPTSITGFIGRPIVFTQFSISLVIFLMVWYANRRLVKGMFVSVSRSRRYTLGLRFQSKENLRAITLMFGLGLPYCAFVGAALIVAYTTQYTNDPIYRIFGRAPIDFLMTLSIVASPIGGAISSPEWRAGLFHIVCVAASAVAKPFSGCRRKQPSNRVGVEIPMHYIESASMDTPSVNDEMKEEAIAKMQNSQKIASIYFKQYDNVWK